MGRSDDVDGSGRASFPELMLGRFAFAVFGGDFKRPNLVPVVKRQADHKVILPGLFHSLCAVRLATFARQTAALNLLQLLALRSKYSQPAST